MKFSVVALMLGLTGCALFQADYSQEDIVRESKRINEFFEDNFKQTVSRYPTFQTYLGYKTNYDQLNNETEAYGREQHELDLLALKKLYTFDVKALDEPSRLSYKLFEVDLKRGIEGYKWRYHGYPLNQMFGYQSTTPAFMINNHQISNKKEAEDYISRLYEIQRVFSERLVDLKIREEKKIYPPQFVFAKVIEDSENIITGQPFQSNSKDSPLFADFKKKIKGLNLKKTEQQKLISKSSEALKKSVLPAYQQLIAYAKELSQKAQKNAGVWNLPNGKDFYNYRLREITTTDLTAEEIHNLGLREVTRIHQEMEKIKKQVNFKGSLSDFFHFMREDKQFFFPGTKAGRAEYLKSANKTIAKMKRALPKMFKTLPKAKLEVKAVEAFREKSAGIAFYTGPGLVGNRPGIYYVNLFKMNENQKYKVEALAYHEAIPGHHMQISIASELKDLPTFRRVGGYTAYTEGWGLYSEFLPKEFGFYSDPYSDFGRLSMELWRACRLVTDTGIHAKKWSREKAIQYLKDNTSNSELEIVKGIERYFIMPGQATAYKIGMLKILEVREKAKLELGEKFDLRKFHDVVLRGGSVPLSVLESEVQLWVQREKKFRDQ